MKRLLAGFVLTAAFILSSGQFSYAFKESSSQEKAEQFFSDVERIRLMPDGPQKTEAISAELNAKIDHCRKEADRCRKIAVQAPTAKPQQPPIPQAAPRTQAVAANLPEAPRKDLVISAMKLPTDKGDITIRGVKYGKGEEAYAIIREDAKGNLYNKDGKLAKEPDIEKSLPPGAKLVPFPNL